VGTNAISAAAQRMEKSPMQRMHTSASDVFGTIAILILSIVAVIVLAAGVPYYFILLGIISMIDVINLIFFGHRNREVDTAANL
jgi:hypothetical protein